MWATPTEYGVYPPREPHRLKLIHIHSISPLSQTYIVSTRETQLSPTEPNLENVTNWVPTIPNEVFPSKYPQLSHNYPYLHQHTHPQLSHTFPTFSVFFYMPPSYSLNVLIYIYIYIKTIYILTSLCAVFLYLSISFSLALALSICLLLYSVKKR